MRFAFLALLLLAISRLSAQGPYQVAAQRQLNLEPLVLSGELLDKDKIGSSFANLGSIPGTPPGVVVAVGARGTDYDLMNWENTGAIWLMHFNPVGKITVINKIDAVDIPELSFDHVFGESMTAYDDLDGDGIPELVVGAPYDSLPGKPSLGSVYVLSFNNSGNLKNYVRITNGIGGLDSNTIPALGRFGSAVAPIGDLDGNGVTDLAVGAPRDDFGGDLDTTGAVYVLFMRANATVGNYRRVDEHQLALASSLSHRDFFGQSLAFLGDISGTGRDVLAVGAWGQAEGKVHLLTFNASGIPNSNTVIDASHPVLAGQLENEDIFGWAVANIGDLNGDGISELAVTAPGDDDATDSLPDNGAVYLLYLDDTGELLTTDKISETRSNFGANIRTADFFASSVGGIGDLDGDGIPDMVVGSRNEKTDGLKLGNFYLIKNDYCRVPPAISGVALDSSSLELSWASVPNGAAYIVQGRVTGTSGWPITDIVAGNVFTLDTLEPGETYDWRITTGCGATQSFNSEITTISMPSPRMGSMDLGLYPNPLSGPLNLSLSGWDLDDVVELTVTNTYGQLMLRRELKIDANVFELTLPEAKNWVDGMYWIDLKGSEAALRRTIVKMSHGAR